VMPRDTDEAGCFLDGRGGSVFTALGERMMRLERAGKNREGCGRENEG